MRKLKKKSRFTSLFQFDYYPFFVGFKQISHFFYSALNINNKRWKKKHSHSHTHFKLEWNFLVGLNKQIERCEEKKNGLCQMDTQG